MDSGPQKDGGGTQSDGGANKDGGSGNDGGTNNDGGGGNGKVVFVIPMENQDLTDIIGNTTDAKYINGTLVKDYASASNFNDELPSLMSEPHYIWMESGTNVFSDHTFDTDDDPSGSNSTNGTAHLSTQLDNAKISWTSYQEGMTANTCPINTISAAFYKPKHNPFVFFQDVSGNPPDPNNAHCVAHHKPLSKLSGDLINSTVSTYNFITPNLCNDMHGDANCANQNFIQAGDDWLKNNLQPIIDYAFAHNGYVFITWDEGNATNKMPFIAIGKHAIAGKASTVKYDHSSLLKSEEEILGVPVLSKVTSANDFADMFDPGTFP